MAAIGYKRTPLIVRLLVGAVLLLPAVTLAAVFTWIPVVDTLIRSLYKFNVLSPAVFVGLQNYVALPEDPLFSEALGLSLTVAGVRLVAVLVLPTLAGWAWARQARWLRVVARAGLSVPLALSAPVAFGLLWPMVVHAATPDSALLSYLALEFVYFLGLGGALAALALTLAWQRPRAGRAVAGVLALAAIAAVASGLDSQTLPQMATGGGPANATTALSLYAYRLGFMQLQFGRASAAIAPQIVVALGLGLLFGLLAEWLDLRLVVAPRGTASRFSVGRLVLGLPVLALLLLTAVILYLQSAIQGLPQVARLTTTLPVWQGIANGTVVPALAVALVQLPVAYLAALSLGLLRPFGRVGSAIVSALLLAGAFVPTLALTMPFLLWMRQANLLDSPAALALPLLSGPVSYFVFRLYFAGRREAYGLARAHGAHPFEAFFRVVFLPSLPVGALAGTLALLFACQSFVWPLVLLSSMQVQPLSLLLMRVQSTSGDVLRQGAAWLLWTVWGVAFLVLWWPLGALLERLQLVAGKEPPAGEAGLTAGL